MTRRRSIEHHRSTEYRVHDEGQQRLGFTVTASPDGRRIEVTGACPSCGGHTTTIWSYGTGNGYKGRRRGGSAPTKRRTVCCDCGHAHANRPADEVFAGCGAYWQVDLP